MGSKRRKRGNTTKESKAVLRGRVRRQLQAWERDIDTPPPQTSKVGVPPQAPVPDTCSSACSCAAALLSAVVPLVPVLAHAPVPCTCTMARPVLFSPCPYPGLPPMAGRLKDFRTSRVASRRRLFPAPDALRSPRSCPSRSHAHARSSFKFAARQSGEL